MVYSITAPHLDKKHKDITPAKLLPFPWDERQKEKPKRSRAEVDAIFAKWDKHKLKKANGKFSGN